jgi:hypothetical protein
MGNWSEQRNLAPTPGPFGGHNWAPLVVPGTRRSCGSSAEWTMVAMPWFPDFVSAVELARTGIGRVSNGPRPVPCQ